MEYLTTKIIGPNLIVVLKNVTLFQAYYKNSHESWNAIFGYDWLLSVLFFLEHKWFLYSWNYGDALIIVLARAIYFQFQAIYDKAIKQVLNITREASFVQKRQRCLGKYNFFN